MQIQEWLPTQLAQDIWENKYRYENETLDEFFDRVAGENSYIRKLIIEKKFLPAGRILANRGLYKLGRKVTYSNCYVIAPPEDNIESIFDCASKLARTYSFGGGCGIDISKLAPRGSKVNNAAKETTGAVSFMDLYSMVTGLIGQSGRRGALMLSLDCNHPDLEEFIDVKSDLNKITKANISIRITNEFMKAVKNKSSYSLKFTRLETGEEIIKSINANEIFNKLIYNNWNMAEPGILFWDEIEKWNLLSEDKNFEYAGVNPCAEEPLPAGGSCLLGSINLSEFVLNSFTKDSVFDLISFKDTVHQAVRYINEILDEGLQLHPLEEQRKSVSDWRQIGLGVMGVADMFIKLGIRYGSEESIALSNSIGFHMINSAIFESSLLANKNGSYPKYNKEAILKSQFFIKNSDSHTQYTVHQNGLRNSQLLTIAPTGSLSTMLGISGGLEPIYNNSYTRKTESLHGKDEYYKIYTPIVQEYMEANNITNEEDLPDYFVTAMTLNYKDRVAMQSIWQSHIDASISSTVNVPESFTVEEVRDLYIRAWENKLKGVTIYRDNCSRSGILTNDIKENINELKQVELPRGFIEEVPDDLVYRKYKLKNGCGNLYFFVGVDEVEGKIYDVFTNTDAVGGCTVNTQANSRLLSAGMRCGCPIEYLIAQLDKSGSCASYQSLRGKQSGMTKVRNMVLNEVPFETIFKIDELIGTPVSAGKSCPSSIAMVLKNILKEFEGIEHESISYKIATKQEVTEVKKILNNECTHPNLRKIEGCMTCPDCGWSKCS